MKSFFNHLKKFFIRGLLATIPIVLTFLVLRLLYVGFDQRLAKSMEQFVGFTIPGMGLLFVFLTLYILGIIASNVIGKRFFALLERIFLKIPIVKTTYQVGSQLSEMISLPEKEVLKRAVLVSYLMPGIWTIGFVTGTLIDKKNNNEKILKVYIPTPPVPTSGTLVLVREEQTRDPGWTIEQAMRAVISGGIIGPDELN
jgi:uncharacterized membrane protein